MDSKERKHLIKQMRNTTQKIKAENDRIDTHLNNKKDSNTTNSNGCIGTVSIIAIALIGILLFIF